MGGWGLKDLHCFSKALVAKGVWSILKGHEICVSVVTNETYQTSLHDQMVSDSYPTLGELSSQLLTSSVIG